MNSTGLIISICLLISLSVDAQRCANREAQVFIIAGQSNANGARDAVTGILPITDNKLKSCKVWNGTSFESLSAVATNNNQYPVYARNGYYSFNIQLLKNIYDSTQQNIYLIQFAIGGTKLYNDGRCWSSEAINSLYDSLMLNATSALAAISSVEDSYTARFYFYQGELDATNVTYANEYETNISKFIDSVRINLGLPNMNTYIMRIHNDMSSVSYPGLSTVRAAQANVCAAKTNCTMITVDDCELSVDGAHLTTAGYTTLANRLSGLIPKKKLIIYKQ